MLVHVLICTNSYINFVTEVTEVKLYKLSTDHYLEVKTTKLSKIECSPDAKKEIKHLAIDEGITIPAVVDMLLAEHRAATVRLRQQIEEASQ